MNMRETAVRLVLLALALVAALLFLETRRLRSQIQKLDEERKQSIIAEFCRDWRSLPEGEKENVVGITPSWLSELQVYEDDGSQVSASMDK